MTADTTRFKRRVWLAQAVSGAVLLFGVVAVILYFDPSLLGVPPGQYPYYKGRFIWLGTGLLFVGLGIAWILVSRRRAKRALWVYRNVPAVPMLLTLEIDEDSDSTTYHALLRTARDEEYRWRAWVDPSFRARSLAGSDIPVEVFIDPALNTPAVIKTELGLLWANPFQDATVNRSTGT